MEKEFASLCVLAFKRPEMLQQALDGIIASVDYPSEIIVNVDGEENPYTMTSQIGNAYYRDRKLSKLILNNGLNRGVGRSLQNCLGVAEGEYIFKIDADLIFKAGWLSTAINILKTNSDVATVSLFNYRNYDPNDNRFNILEERENCYIVDDFVSSVFGTKTSTLKKYLADHTPLPDDGIHQGLGGKLAITKDDLVINQGFGLEKSVYLNYQKHDIPCIFPLDIEDK